MEDHREGRGDTGLTGNDRAGTTGARLRQEGRVDDINLQLQRLKSPNKNTRYDACEMMRVASSIPPEALDALREATADQDPLVAEAARDALRVHTEPPPDIPILATPAATLDPFWGNPWRKLVAIGFVFVTTFILMGILGSGHFSVRETMWSWLFFPAFFFAVFPGCILVLFPLFAGGGDYVGPEVIYAGWLVYIVVSAAVIVIDNARVAKALFSALVIMVLLNLAGWLVLSGGF